MTLSCFVISEQLVHHRKLLPSSIAEFKVQAHFDFGWDFGEIQVRECSSVHDLVEYMSRYLRRPPIARSRLLSYDGKTVAFRYKDTKSGQTLVERCSADDFIRRLADQVPDRYRHGVHFFGLLASRCKGREYEVFRILLGLKRRTRPRRTPWRKLIWSTFRRDPLLASNGEVMQKIGWLAPLGAKL